MLRRVMAVLGMTVVLGCLAGIASADEFHYNNLIIGDRAIGMGGAYTGISDDPSGLYYNPAGVVYTTGRNLSASVNAFYSMNKKYNGVIGGLGWERNATALLPNFFGIVQPFGKLKFGFSYAVPDSIKEDQDQTFYGSLPTGLGSPATRYTINFNNEDNTYLFGPSIAAELTSRLSAGLTLYVYHRSNQSTLNQFIQLQDGRYEWSNQYIEKVERGYKPILGFMITPVEKLSIGISVAKTFLTSASMETQTTVKDAEVLPTNTITITNPPGDASKRKFPTEVRLGAAYFASPSLLVSADAAYYTKVSDPENGDRVSVVNIAVGSEYFLNKNWALRGGIYTNMANTPDLDASRFNQDEKVDLYGMSLSISNYSRNTSVTFGGSMATGSGDAQILANSSNIQTVDVESWMIFLSSSYSY